MRMRTALIFATLAALAAGARTVVSAQGTNPAPRYTPAPGAKDLKAVLFNWFWHMGMLRGPQ